MIEFLLFMSWALSLGFALLGGVALGYAKAHRDRMQFIDGLKSKALELIEGVKCQKN